MTKMEVQNLEYTPLFHSPVADRILAYIQESNLKGGDKLIGERELAAKWNISRTSIREAKRELETRGILMNQPRSGTFILALGEPNLWQIILDKRNFWWQFEIKTVLEEYVLRKVALTMTDSKLDQLEKLARKMIQQTKKGIFPEALDDQFHELLLQDYDNQEMTNIIKEMIQSFHNNKTTNVHNCLQIKTHIGESIMDTIPYHLKMVESLRQRKPQEVIFYYRKIIDLDIEIYRRIEV